MIQLQKSWHQVRGASKLSMIEYFSARLQLAYLSA
jgi:hypothetical protein